MPSGAHSTPAVNKDRDLILQELLNSAVFSPGTARHHTSFPHVRVWMESFDREVLLSWIIEHMN